MHKKKKGNRNNNNTKNNKVKETKIVGNRCSRLQEIVTNIPEVMEEMRKAVEEEKPQNDNKEENERNRCDVDSAEMQTLDEEIKKHVEHDQNGHIENNITLKDNSDDAENNQNHRRSNKNFDMDTIKHQNDLLFFRLEQSEEREASLKRALEDLKTNFQNDIVLEEMTLKEQE